MAVINDFEIYANRKEEIVARVFGVIDPGHPYIEHIYSGGDWLIGGEIQLLDRIRQEPFQNVASTLCMPGTVRNYIPGSMFSLKKICYRNLVGSNLQPLSSAVPPAPSPRRVEQRFVLTRCVLSTLRGCRWRFSVETFQTERALGTDLPIIISSGFMPKTGLSS